MLVTARFLSAGDKALHVYRHMPPCHLVSLRVTVAGYRGGGGGGFPGGGGGGLKLDGAETAPLLVADGAPPLILPDTGTRCPLAYMH